MTNYFCLISLEEVRKGTSVGRVYADQHRTEWVQFDASSYLSSGYVKGVDHITKDGKSYWIAKSYIDLDENFVLFICVESNQGCDVVSNVKTNKNNETILV